MLSLEQPACSRNKVGEIFIEPFQYNTRKLNLCRNDSAL